MGGDAVTGLPEDATPPGVAFDPLLALKLSDAGSVGHLRIGKAKVVGQLAPEVVQRVVRRYHGQYRRCYQLELKKDHQLQGKATMKFVIGQGGEVSMATAQAPWMKTELAQCLGKITRAARFPKPKGGIVTVNLPFTFSANSHDPL